MEADPLSRPSSSVIPSISSPAAPLPCNVCPVCGEVMLLPLRVPHSTLFLTLRAVRWSDAASLAQHADSEAVTRHLPPHFPRPYRLQDAEAFIALTHRRYAEEQRVSPPPPALSELDDAAFSHACHGVAFLPSLSICVDDRCVGNIGAFAFKPGQLLELGYWLGEQYQSRGVMSAVLPAVIAYIAQHFPPTAEGERPEAIRLRIAEANAANRRIAEKLGFSETERAVDRTDEVVVISYCRDIEPKQQREAAQQRSTAAAASSSTTASSSSSSSSSASSSASSAAPDRVLCFHGFTQSAAIFKSRTAALRKSLRRLISLEYAQAPHEIAPGSHAFVSEDDAAARPKCSWWLVGDSAAQIREARQYRGVADSIAAVKTACKEAALEPYTGLLAFSQGAAFAALLLQLHALHRLALQRGRSLSSLLPASLASSPSLLPLLSVDYSFLDSLRFAILIAAFVPRDPDIRALFELQLAPIALPTLHVMGSTDSNIATAASEEVAACCVAPELFRHGGGHLVPAAKEARAIYIAFLERCKQEQKQEQVATDIRRPAAEAAAAAATDGIAADIVNNGGAGHSPAVSQQQEQRGQQR